MKPTILVAGYGPGISHAVARRFGAEGFAVALAARSADRLAAGVKTLEAEGVVAVGFSTDLGDAKAVKTLISDVRAKLGPITIVHWNAYAAGLAGDLTTATVADLNGVLGVGVVGLVVAVQEALPDLRSQPNAAVLVTGGGLSAYDAKVDAMAVQWGSMGLALTKAAQHKLVGLLGERLAPDGIYVGEVTVLSLVKGTAFDDGKATLEPSTISARFWEIYTARAPRSVTVAG